MSIDKSSHPDSPRSIIRSTSIISLGTLASRILGFFRDVILAKLLGTGFQAEAFFVAFKIPNLFRDLVGEGAVNAAVVPVFSEYLEKQKREEFWRFVSVVFCLALIMLSVITILGMIFAPVVVRVLAPGFMANPPLLALTIKLTVLMFPYLIFIGLTAYSVGLLFTFRSFAVSAFSPCLLNIAVIISAYFATRHMEEPVFGLAIGVLVGGLLQLIAQFIPFKKIGIQLRWPKTLVHPGAQKIGRLLIPRVVGGGVYQLTVFLDTFCASLSAIVGEGGISAIYYANRIIQFPMGIFSVALASAMLPTLSGLYQKKQLKQVQETIVFSLESIFFIMFPTTVIILMLSTPIIRVIFERGEFSSYSTVITSSTLAFYAVGLFSFGGIKILVTSFHALQDTKTPVIVAAICLTINAALNFILMVPLKVAGIALASSIAGTVDFFILFMLMQRRLGAVNFGLFQYLIKATLASVLTGLFVYLSWQYFVLGSETIKLILVGGLAYIFYGLVCLMMGIKQAQKIVGWIRGVKSSD